MQDGCHNHRLPGLVHFVNDAIRKTVRIAPTDVFVRMTAGIEQGIFFERVPNPDDFFHELHTQSGLSGFIPDRSCNILRGINCRLNDRRRHIPPHIKFVLESPSHLSTYRSF